MSACVEVSVGGDVMKRINCEKCDCKHGFPKGRSHVFFFCSKRVDVLVFETFNNSKYISKHFS